MQNIPGVLGDLLSSSRGISFMIDSTDASKGVEFEPSVRLASASAKSVVKKSIARWMCGVSAWFARYDR